MSRDTHVGPLPFNAARSMASTYPERQQRRRLPHPLQLTPRLPSARPPRQQTATGPDSPARSTSNKLTGRLR